MNIKEDLKKRILSKIEEGYAKGGKLIEMGEVALYPDPAPAVDPTVQGSGKTLQVDSDLLRDLLNWATSADAGSIDAVVAKAEEMGVGAPLTPAQLVDLTATAHTADPSNPTVAAPCATDAQPGITSPVVPAGPVGPLSPVMASFMRRGKKVEELVALPKMDKSGAVQVKTAQQPGKAAPLPPKNVAQLARAEKKAQAAGVDPGEMTLYGNEGDEHGNPEKPEDLEDHSDDQKNRHIEDGEREDMFDSEQMKEDDIIDSDNEVITQPEQMGKKNPGIKADGGQGLPDDTTRPIGKLNDPANMGGKGLAEDGIEDEAGGVEDAAAAIAGGIADGLAGDTIETEPEVTALPGEGIPQNDDDAAINAELGAPVAPPVGEPASQEGGEGLVGQVAALQARVAELEALLGGTAAEAPEAEIEVGGEEGEDELAVDGEEGEEETGEENGEEAEENGEEDEDDDEESDEEGEASDDEEENDEAGEDEGEEEKKLLLGDEEEEKK